jgi:hypothetical protein
MEGYQKIRKTPQWPQGDSENQRKLRGLSENQENPIGFRKTPQRP